MEYKFFSHHGFIYFCSKKPNKNVFSCYNSQLKVCRSVEK